MLSTDLKNVLTPMARIMMIIWGAMMAATLVYLLVARLVLQPGEEELPAFAGGSDLPLAPILGVAAFLIVLASIVVERSWFSGARITGRLAAGGSYESLQAAGQAAGMPARADFEKLAEGDRRLLGLVPYYQTGMIVVWAMREAVAIFGLVGAIITGDFMVAVPFCVGALALLAVKMPRPAAFLEQVQRLPGAMG